MSEDERRAKDEVGLAALKAWDEAHRDVIVYDGGPLGPTKRASPEGVTDVVNELTVSSSCARRRMKLRPRCSHFTIFPCDAVDVMPLLSANPDA